MLLELFAHEADRSPSGTCRSPEHRWRWRGGVAGWGAVALGSLLGAAGCAEPQQSVKRYQPAPTSRPCS